MKIPILNKEFDVVVYHTNKNIGKIGMTVLCLFGLLLANNVWGGYSAKQNEVHDASKSALMASVIQALELFYKDSSDLLESRNYPVARCSNELNSFDFEYTLRGELTGNKSFARSHDYIKVTAFPNDPLGNYSANFGAKFPCRSALPPSEQGESRYFDGSTFCNFDIASNKDCFLYTSSLIGDSYKLSYWSPFYKKYVVYTKYRTEDIQVKLF